MSNNKLSIEESDQLEADLLKAFAPSTAASIMTAVVFVILAAFLNIVQAVVVGLVICAPVAFICWLADVSDVRSTTLTCGIVVASLVFVIYFIRSLVNGINAAQASRQDRLRRIRWAAKP